MNELQVFKNSQFGNLEILTFEGKEWFPAIQVAEILGYANPRDAISRHTKNKGVVNHDVLSNGGVQRKKFIDEGNLYRLITRSKLPQADEFEEWVFEDVLPSIRKHGLYATDNVIENTLNNPDYIINILTEYKKEKEHNLTLEQQIKDNKPKVLFADSVAGSENSILVGELAKLLKQNGVDVGQNRLFKWLRNNGYLIKKSGESYNLPTQKSMDLEILDIKKRVINNPDGSSKITRTPKVTGKGQQYFINKFLAGEL
ncbi:phage antirepressor [Staphylococcus haemolyticus]|uniref:phage antirepressor n=1 Tax=Staphylococcus haemolyticus TaxID=1283 RepID=UPI0016430317|nr:phage antirepressor KilAC domain-containing protein [Staphylococcus haemolyticus]MBC3101985.1 phage antirepressor KilAC domain-containing protein [Staphylococcus haemolyticus]MBC3142842.1 phage antirepressor KilAC domain-containing protein [Staphylococcus haemolyticus]